MTSPEPGKGPEKKSRKALYAIVGGVAGAAVIAGSIIGIETAGGGHTGSGPKKSDKATSETSPTPTPSETDQPLTVESVEIKAGLTPEQLGRTFVQRLSDWEMAGGVTADNYKSWEMTNGATASQEYSAQLAEQAGAIYAEALFGPDWRAVPNVQTYVPNEIKSSSTRIQMAFQTQPGNDRRDKAPYKSWSTVDAVRVISQSDTQIVEQIDYTEHNNADENRAEELSTPEFVSNNGAQGTINVTFNTQAGVEHATSLNIVSR